MEAPIAQGHGERPILARLLAPCESATFEERYLEREPLYVGRSDPSYHAEVFGVGDVEDALAVGAREPDRITLIKTGEPALPLETYAMERRATRARDTLKGPVTVVDPRVVSVAFAQGYTVVLKDAAAAHAGLGRLCLALQAELGAPVQANVYFTPPHAQGFEIHHDTHDTLVLQIEGTKTWRIYAPAVELPLESQSFSARAHGAAPALVREVTLHAGDTLYVPRGFLHAASTEATRSLHVTLALLPIRAIDVIDAMLRFAALGDVELRRAMPRGWATDPQFPARFAAFVAERLAEAWTPGRAYGARILALQEMFASSRVDIHGAFDAVAAFERADDSIVVRFADYVPAVISPVGTPTVHLAGKTLTFPDDCGAALAMLARGPATVAEIAATFPNKSAAAFLATLVADGLLIIDDDRP